MRAASRSPPFLREARQSSGPEPERFPRRGLGGLGAPARLGGAWDPLPLPGPQRGGGGRAASARPGSPCRAGRGGVALPAAHGGRCCSPAAVSQPHSRPSRRLSVGSTTGYSSCRRRCGHGRTGLPAAAVKPFQCLCVFLRKARPQ